MLLQRTGQIKHSVGVARLVLFLAVAGLAWPLPERVSRVAAQGRGETSREPNLTQEEMRQFLLTAKVIKSRRSPKGVTAPLRLTLTDGTLVHDASFQSIDETTPMKRLDHAGLHMNYRDSYHYNIAAYELAKLLELDSMMPVTVERKWGASVGSLTWWLPAVMDEGEMEKRRLAPPDLTAWNKQVLRMHVFSQLVYDIDRNPNNVLIGADWRLYMIDFSRGFRLHADLEDRKLLVMCDRRLLENLHRLDRSLVSKRVENHLTEREVESLMERRDKIVAHFRGLIAEKGEQAVFY